MEIKTPLGEDLLFYGLHAKEELGRLSTLQLDLLSKNGKIALDDILGKNVTVKVELPDDSTRYFNGYITRFTQQGTHGRYHRYTALAQPWLWFLTRTSDCRIFQEMTVPDILKKVFSECEQQDVKFTLTGSFRKWTYCVQYRETDFNFVSRLMEHEGIYYYFKHGDGRHTMVIANSPSGHEPYPGYAKVKFIAPERLGRPDIEYIRTWELTRQIQPGVFVHTDYDLERPSVNLKTQKALPRTYSPSSGEMYDYPGIYIQKPDGEAAAGVRIGEYGAQFEHAQAATNARGMSAGCLFTLEGCPRDDQNAEHLILATSHDLEYSQYEALPEGGAMDFRCQFTAMSTKEQFRPKRATPKPFVQGPQTAVVVGPSGDEIYTDKYGRVKVQFHWDRYGTKDENSSCWIRVSHPWAGKGWGAVSTPRIGQEVIVDFLEGDPDQPIITGRVYNAEQMPPFGAGGAGHVSGFKSDTHKGDGYNEMSLDDTAGSEKITIHGQYDMNTTVLHDQTTTVNNNRTDKVVVDDSETVGNNQTMSVGVNQSLTVGANQTISVGANQSISVGSSETETVAVAKALSIGAAYQVSVGGAMNETVGGLKAEEIGGAKMVNVGAISSENVGANKSTNASGNISETAGSNIANSAGGKFSASAGSDFSGSAGGKMAFSAGGDFSVKGGAKGLVDIATELTLQCGGASIVLKSGGDVIIKGTKITIEGSTKIDEKAPNITAEASAKNTVKGAMVDVEASGVNTIKGSLVKIN
jgi:type VI secretion system secreted protein VgrG